MKREQSRFKSRAVLLLALFLAAGFTTPATAQKAIELSDEQVESQANEWERIVGAEELRVFISGATTKITLTPGVVAKGEYFPDGTAKIEAWDEVFPRTWEVRGDDQFCFSSETDTNCFFLERRKSRRSCRTPIRPWAA
jgi:hypothetical protein